MNTSTSQNVLGGFPLINVKLTINNSRQQRRTRRRRRRRRWRAGSHSKQRRCERYASNVLDSLRTETSSTLQPETCRNTSGITSWWQRRGSLKLTSKKGCFPPSLFRILLLNCMLQSRGEGLSQFRHPELGIPTNQSRQREDFRRACCQSRRLGWSCWTSHHPYTHRRVTSLWNNFIAATLVSNRSKK